tara:strand:- start:20868 stop:21179 length:312 start_codon:yes stop_codon:yes gene_type:complete
MKIIKSQTSSSVFYYISSGNWSSVVSARSRKDALRQLFNDIIKNPGRYGPIGTVIVLMDIDEAMKDLTLESALKFISTEEALEMVGDPDISESILGEGDPGEF